MFIVRSARAVWPPSLESDLPRARRSRRRRLRARPASRPAPRPASHAPPFDSAGCDGVQPQPLSFDTTKVTDMGAMFYVCSARALVPKSLASDLPSASPLAPPLPTGPPASRPAPRPPSYAPPFRLSAGGKLPVRRQQAVHPLRVGGHLGLRKAFASALAMVARAELLEAAPVAEMAALKIGWPAYVQRARHGHARCGGASLSLGGAAGAGVDQLTGGEGGEEKDEGRVGVRSNNRPKHHKQPRRREGKPGSGTGRGGLYIH